MIAIISLLVLSSYPEWGDWARALFEFPVAFGPWIDWFTTVTEWVAVMFTVLSGSLYLWTNRSIYLDDL